MRRLLVVLAVLLCSAVLNSQETPKYELFGGYSLLHNEGANANGWEASGAYNFNRWIGVKADVSGHYRGDSNDLLRFSVHHHFFTVGPQYSWRSKHATLFGHTLFGLANEDSYERVFFPRPPGIPQAFEAGTNSFATIVGGGGDWNFGKRLSWRVAQIDYVQNSAFSRHENHLRVSSGLVFLFGKR
jgi:hypothetical protein